MIGSKSLRVSLVIPVYNEADRIGPCLEAIARQSAAPYEVIVVDNNSTDATAQVAAKFPAVRVITAKRQGVVHARNRGFNAARGDIIGRIDADTRLPADWVATVQRLFAEDSLDAVSGAIAYHDLPLRRLAGAIDLSLRRRAARMMGDEVFLQGANMAVRRSSWNIVKKKLCPHGGLHEDFDLAIHLAEAGLSVRFDETLRASISARCLDDTIAGFWTYVLLSPGTYAKHNVRSGRYMYPIVVLALLFHLPLRALYRSTAPITDYQRVNPATFVD